jgi:hypothetical protein
MLITNPTLRHRGVFRFRVAASFVLGAWLPSPSLVGGPWSSVSVSISIVGGSKQSADPRYIDLQSALTPAAKELPHIVDEELRLLECGEVAAARHVGQLL